MNKNESKYFNTAMLMDEALIELLAKKDYDYITVKEICNKAMVNRSTFYLHYETIDDLLSETIELINKRFYSSFENSGEVSENIRNKEKSKLILVTPKYLKPYLQFIKENRNIFKLTVNKPELFNASSAFEMMYSDYLKPILDMYNVPLFKHKYILSFYCHGMIAIIMKWLDDDCKLEIDKVIDLISECLMIKEINEKYGENS